MQRKQLEFLSSWFGKKRRKPLVIRSARQVGKSTLVEMFARQNQIAICTVNLERHPELTSAFSSKDPRKIIQQIEFLPNIGSITPGTLLFLDEIQAIPEAIVALRNSLKLNNSIIRSLIVRYKKRPTIKLETVEPEESGAELSEAVIMDIPIVDDTDDDISITTSEETESFDDLQLEVNIDSIPDEDIPGTGPKEV
jgi:hypothetical protein